jgi:hypothetical protein
MKSDRREFLKGAGRDLFIEAVSLCLELRLPG